MIFFTTPDARDPVALSLSLSKEDHKSPLQLAHGHFTRLLSVCRCFGGPAAIGLSDDAVLTPRLSSKEISCRSS